MLSAIKKLHTVNLQTLRVFVNPQSKTKDLKLILFYQNKVLGLKGVDKISPNSNFSQQYLPEVLNWG